MAAVRSGKFIMAGILAVALLVGAAGVFAFSLGKYEKAKISNGEFSLPVAKLGDGKAHFFKLEEGGREIGFFIIKASDGSYKAAFDACDACYRAKKGYEQEGDKMLCKNCKQKFAVNRLGPNATGGCNPGYLPHQISGTNLTIKVDDLKSGARYF